MKGRIKYLLILIVCCCVLDSYGQDTTLLNFTFPSINGDTISFPANGGKKFLLVITASLDSNSSQLLELKKLQQQYSGAVNLVIIPTNDFNTEPGTNEMINSVFQSMSFTVSISSKLTVSGSQLSPFFDWLRRQTPLTGSNYSPSPFVKYLFNASGVLEKVFLATIRPMNSLVTTALSN